jgi:hypothetical protein
MWQSATYLRPQASRSAVLVACSTSLLLVATSSSLEAKAEQPQFELGAKVGYLSPPITGGTSPFGAGFGGRIGFSISGFYVGASVVDYLGGSDIDISNRALFYGVEVGYGLRVPLSSSTFFTLRPQVGVGNAAIMHTDPSTAKVDVVTTASGRSSSTTSDTVTVNNIYVEPALVAMFSSRSHFAALTANTMVIPGISYGGEAQTWLSYGLSAQLGFLF